MPRWLTFVVLILLLFLLASIPMAKQFETGSIQGTITDQLGPVAQASVEARNVVTGEILDAKSDRVGFYRLENLHPGKYSLWVQARYHDSLWIQQIAVDHGQAVQHDIFLLATPKETFGLPTSSPSDLASR